MRRDPALRQLSSDHHSGLVAARRAWELAERDPAGRDQGWRELQGRFATELEPHFRLEEQGLLPALRAAGREGLVERTLAEHRRLRALIAEDNAEGLLDFARALTDHIRFEETELFETAQVVLDRATLARLADLHREGARPGCASAPRGGER